MGIENEEDLAGLSDEERAALEDDDDESEIISKIAGDGADDDEEGGGDNGEADDSAAGGNDGSDAGAGADEESADGADAGADDQAPVVAQEEFRPEFKADRPEGIAEKLAWLETQTADLLAKFKDGEIDMPDFMAQKEAIDEQKLNLKMADEQAKWSEKQNVEIEQQFNARITKQFFDRPAAKLYEDEIMYSVLDRTVAALRAKDPAKGYEWALTEADRQVRQRFKLASEPPPPKTREPDLSKVPKTLAQLPAAEMAETGNEEFAYLDKLEGIALEQALRKLTPEQEARYLGAAA